MTASVRPLGRWFVIGFVAVALVLAGGVSYFASASPDGLESVLARGCQDTGGELRGSCLAQSATDHAFADSALADYTVDGDDGMTGLAGVIGVVVTLALATGMFRLLRRRPE